jgi:adenylylsulfate kinase
MPSLSSVNSPHAHLVSSNNISWHAPVVDRKMRETLNAHKSFVLWFTGLSGAGKSTLSHYLEEQLHHKGYRTYVLDGDNIRHGLCADLGFTASDRQENIRRIGEACKLFVHSGVVVLTAFISPLHADRDKARALVGDQDFVEIYCNADLAVCEQRDTKGLYKKARAGLIKDFTGISSPYEAPVNPELIINTADWSLADCADAVLDYLESSGMLNPAALKIVPIAA